MVVFGSALKSEAAPKKSKRGKPTPAKSSKASAAVLPKATAPRADCNRCDNPQTAKKRVTRKNAKSQQKIACHPKGYVDPRVAKNYNKAMRDLKRAGITPTVTSTWRSSHDQARLHDCSRSSRCRRSHPGLYYAMPAGQSLHEAGFAVDISGVASGPRGKKRLTKRGKKIVAVMKNNGFNWRYGLADPVHFEANPREYGYRSVKQAINRNQTQCTIGKAKKATPKKSTGARASAKTAAAKRASSKAALQNGRATQGS